MTHINKSLSIHPVENLRCLLSVLMIFTFFLLGAVSAKTVCTMPETPVLKKAWKTSRKFVKTAPPIEVGGTIFDTTVASGLQSASDKKKRLLVFMKKDGCVHCSAFEQEILPQITIKDFLAENFVCARVLHGSHDERILKKDFGCNAFPHFVIFDYDGKFVTRWFGEPHSATDFTNMAKKAI